MPHLTSASRAASTTSDADAKVNWPVIAAVVITVLAWASAFVVIRFVGRDFSAGALSLGRLAVGSVALTVTALTRQRVRLTGREWGLIVVIGVAWFGIYNLALNEGERHVDAGTAAMLIQVAPILIGVLAGFLLGEGFPPTLVLGGLVAFAGTLVIGIATSTGRADFTGVLLVLVSAVVYSIAMVTQKVVLRRVPGIQVTWLACVIGMIVCLPFAGSLVRAVATAPASSILGVVYLGLVPTALAFSTWAYALSRTDAGKLGVSTYVVPPVAIGLAWVFLHEAPALIAILGGLLSLVGVGIARRRPKPRPAVPETAAQQDRYRR